MLLATQTSGAFKYFDMREGIKILKNAGYDSLDLTMTKLSTNPEFPLSGDNALHHAEELKCWANEEGLSFTQAHTPFEFHWEDPNEMEERFFPLTIKGLKLAATVGATIVVVHPYNYLEKGKNLDEYFELNMKIYKRLIPYAKEFGVKIAVENMFRRDSKRNVLVASTCGTPDDMIRYVDTLDSEYVVACLDLGHSAVAGIEPEDFIRALGADRLQALHVHDNSYRSDDHTLPGLGKMNWDEITRALADINYQGNFTYESDAFLKNFEDEFKPVACRFMAERGRYLINKIESYKQR